MLARLPHPEDSHHRRDPGRDRSTNRREQSVAAHSRIRLDSVMERSSIASRATADNAAETETSLTRSHDHRGVRRGAGSGDAAHRLTVRSADGGGGLPARRASTQSKIADRRRRASTSASSDASTPFLSRPTAVSHDARSGGVRSRSNPRRQRSPIVATKSNDTAPAPKWNSNSARSMSSKTSAWSGTTGV